MGEPLASLSKVLTPSVALPSNQHAVAAIVEEVDVSNEVAAMMLTSMLEEQLSGEDSVKLKMIIDYSQSLSAVTNVI